MTVWADFLNGAGYTDAQIATIKSKVQTMYNTYLSSHQADLDELKSKIISGSVVVPVPASGDIAVLRALYEGAFQAGVPLSNILIAVALAVVVLGVGYYVLFMRGKPTGK